MTRWLPRDVRPIDVGVALLLGLVVAAVVVAFPAEPGTLLGLRDPGQLVCSAIAAVVLVARRRAPVAVAALIAVVTIAFPGNYFAYAALYAAGAHTRRRWWLWLLVPLTVGCSFLGERGWVGFRPNDHAFVTVMSILFALAGLYVGTRRTLIATATERADRAEREQQLLAAQARAEERVRLAAEMHDVVTRRVNLMVLQAGALGVQSHDPGVLDAAEAVRASGVQALDELRDLIGVLRSAGDPTAVEDVDDAGGMAELVAGSRAVGVEVDLTEEGDPEVLAPTVRRALLRVVQESLTNAHKHAWGVRVDLDLHYDARGATVDVRTPPAAADSGLAATGSGSGLDGLRRRVSMVGGTFSAGPDPTGVFVVHASLPAYVPTTGAPTTGTPTGEPAPAAGPARP